MIKIIKSRFQKKAIIFDSGALITLSMSGLLEELKQLKLKFSGKFLITRGIEEEIVKKPMKIPKYKLGALRLKNLIDEKILEYPESLGVDLKLLEQKKKEIMNLSNKTFFRGNEAIHIIDDGEAEGLALSEILNEMKIKNIIAIDERTTRVLGEKPENLRDLLESKLHTKITMKGVDTRFKNFKFIRSTELIYVMFKKGVIKNPNKELLDAMLHSARSKGCAISTEEIKEIKNIGY